MKNEVHYIDNMEYMKTNYKHGEDILIKVYNKDYTSFTWEKAFFLEEVSPKNLESKRCKVLLAETLEVIDRVDPVNIKTLTELDIYV